MRSGQHDDQYGFWLHGVAERKRYLLNPALIALAREWH
jgi:hypothetical protein